MANTNIIQSQADEIAGRHFVGSSAKRVNVFGGVGRGKTSVLFALKDSLKARGKAPILVAPQPAQIDTAAVALLQIAQGLGEHDLLGDRISDIKNPSISFKEKVGFVSEALNRNWKDVVLLCDEPNEWAMRSNGNPLFYDSTNDDTLLLAKAIGDKINCSRVIAERYWDGETTSISYHQLQNLNDTDSLKAATHFQDELGQLLSRNPKLKDRSFLHLRLLGALKAAGADPPEQEFEKDSYLVNYFVQFFVQNEFTDSLISVASKLALINGSIEEDLLNDVGFGIESLSGLESRLVRQAFLSKISNNLYVMHPLIRYAVEEANILTSEERVQTHGNIAKWQGARLVELREQNRVALEVEYRGYSQSARAGLASIEGFSHYFVSQLHVWGRTLSRDLQRYAQAADVFRQAVKEDPKDDYGHHYIAYNQDVLAIEEESTERHYRKAVEWNHEHPWYWSRWINFLITTGRMDEAKREWSLAGDALLVSENCDNAVFSHLHFWVAHLLLHRAQLDFAEQILNEVPEAIRKTESRFIELDRLLDGLRIARDERAVFPAYIAPSDYWTEYPHLRQPFVWKGLVLTEFCSARVEAIDDELVSLVAGKKSDNDVRYGAVELARSQFDAALETSNQGDFWAGRFVELCFYGEENLLRIDLYPEGPPNPSVLPMFDPPNTRRYLENWDPCA